jgi:hypothetical protein
MASVELTTTTQDGFPVSAELPDFAIEHYLALVRPKLPTIGAATAEAARLTIDDQFTFEYAAEILKVQASGADDVEAERLKLVEPINSAKTKVQAFFKQWSDDYAAASLTIRKKMQAHMDAEKAKARKAQAEAEEASRKERERLKAEADALRAANKPEAAAAVDQVVQVISAPIASAPPPVAKGISTRKNWKCRREPEAVDVLKLAAFVIAHPEHAGLIAPEWSNLDKMAKAMEDRFNVPGVQAFNDEGISARRSS